MQPATVPALLNALIPRAQGTVKSAAPGVARPWPRVYTGSRPAGPRSSRGLTSVYVCGLATDFCLFWSVMDARWAGFAAYVIEEDLAPGDSSGVHKMWAESSRRHRKREVISQTFAAL